MVFGPPNWTPKSLKFALKTKSKKREHREAKFHGFRSNFGVENRPKNVPVGEKQIWWKTLFLLSKTKVFQPWGPPKIIKFAARNEDMKQTVPKLEISMICLVILRAKSTGKAMQNGVCFATLWNPPRPRCNTAEIGGFRLSIGLLSCIRKGIVVTN